MISHVFVGVTDFAKSFEFYAKLMHELHLTLRFNEPEKPWAGWQAPDQRHPLLLIGHAYNGAPASVGNGHMVALLAPSRDAVDRAHAAALAVGGICDGVPGLRPQYHEHYYGAYFRDPDGNKLCVCCHHS